MIGERSESRVAEVSEQRRGFAEHARLVLVFFGLRQVY